MKLLGLGMVESGTLREFGNSSKTTYPAVFFFIFVGHCYGKMDENGAFIDDPVDGEVGSWQTLQ